MFSDEMLPCSADSIVSIEEPIEKDATSSRTDSTQDASTDVHPQPSVRQIARKSVTLVRNVPRKAVRAYRRKKRATKAAISTSQISVSTRIASRNDRWSSPVSRALGRRFTPDYSRLTLEQLRALVPSSDVEQLMKVGNHLWGRTGMLRELSPVLATLRANASEDPAVRAFISKFETMEECASLADLVPEALHSPAFKVERNRILYCVHATPAYSSNGYATRTRGVARGLSQLGKQIRVIARSGYPWDSPTDIQKPQGRRTSVPIDGIEYVHRTGKGLGVLNIREYVLQAADDFVREALMYRPSVIVAASNYVTALPALIAARRLGIPFVYEVRGLWEVSEATGRSNWQESDKYRIAVELESLVCREANLVLAITRQVANVIQSRGISRTKILVTPNAVASDEFLPFPKDRLLAAQHGIDIAKFTIGYMGSLVTYEGLETLIQASKTLDSLGISHQIVIAGSGSDEKQLKELALENRLGAVKFLGRLPRDEMPRLTCLMDVIVIPRLSVPVTELVSPIKPLEAFSAARCVVLSDVEPHQDIAQDGSIASLFAAGDSNSLARVLADLEASPDERAAQGRRARTWAKAERNWATVLQAPVQQIDEICAGWHPDASTVKRLGDVRVGLIADEFTTKTLQSTFQVVQLSSHDYESQLSNEPLDLVFIESAWSGNDGNWHRLVGTYEDQNECIFNLINRARELGIPTVFWNKEDPVHFQRFKATASECDHVFTTDSSLIPTYLKESGGAVKTVSSLPFYAQPKIHNPMSTAKIASQQLVYAGTFYGKRFPKRSKELAMMLESAAPFGLTIYDRQASLSDSPYRFPEELSSYVKGALPYDEVLDSYTEATAHINVNSVTDSPTMYSRRVIEIAASGGVVVSGSGRGIPESLGPCFEVAIEPDEFLSVFEKLTSDPLFRHDLAFRQMRAVYRSHLAETEMAIMCRMAGIPVIVDMEPWIIAGDNNCFDNEELQGQSVRVMAVGSSSSLRDGTDRPYVLVSKELPYRTFVEDLSLCRYFYEADEIYYRFANAENVLEPIVNNLGSEHEIEAAGYAIGLLRGQGGSRKIGITLPSFNPQQFGPEASVNQVLHPSHVTKGLQTVLFAGHDFKFIRPFIDFISGQGTRVLVDQWESHVAHDATRSEALLDQADVIFCEWGLGNLSWFSHRVRKDQRLVVRIHSQEIRRDFLRFTNFDAVDYFIFVSPLVREYAVQSFGIPAEKTLFIPNFVDNRFLPREVAAGERRRIGFVGSVPQSKRLDLALDFIEKLLPHDPTFQLVIKGKTYADYPWMLKREDELRFYQEQAERINRINLTWPDSVVFEPFSTEMASWYSTIEFALSTSDFECFHYTLPDGAIAGATPISLAWPGADLIYPSSWLFSSVDEMANAIMSNREVDSLGNRKFVEEHYGSTLIFEQLEELLK